MDIHGQVIHVRSHALNVLDVSIIGDIRFSKQLYLTRFWSHNQRSMDRRECDTHISTHARVVRIVVIDFVIENISCEESVSLSVLLANKNLTFSEDNER